MCALKLDIPSFISRCGQLYKDWRSNASSQLHAVDAVVIPAGKFDSVYGKTLSLHVWLFGYELQDTIIVFCEKSIFILCGKKKIEFLQPLTKRNDENREVILIQRNPSDNDKAEIGRLISAISTSRNGRIVGHLAKDKFSSELTSAFQSALQTAKFEMLDISGACSDLFAVKDENELNLLKKASNVTCNVFTKGLREEIMDTIDYDRKMKHSKLSGSCQAALKKANLLNGLDPDSLEMCYDPIIQSGGRFNLKFSIESDDQNLHFGVIICALGVRYQSYCSNVIRTLLVNPTEEQSTVYAYLHDLLDWAIAEIKPGMKVADFCQSVIKKVESERPDLSDNLIRSFG
ncbi:hypothetical protein EG68_11121 [Paragonimus skrjabini miyazakii]|uniref:FACT complex subunit n=1 Tax=Paragonimus skrjabini miyazakii TaxID=59628 RepID=A0A8S9YTF4_9TREM|nr:hypothetical protein EG68_11121 [Paragonimus skrjabini miyazakii]